MPRRVAPVVTTSSTITTGAPGRRSSLGTGEASRMRRVRRCLAPCPPCPVVGTARSSSGRPAPRRDIARTSSAVWSSPRRSRARRRDGTGTSSGPSPEASPAARRPSCCTAVLRPAAIGDPRCSMPPFFHASTSRCRSPVYSPSASTGSSGAWSTPAGWCGPSSCTRAASRSCSASQHVSTRRGAEASSVRHPAHSQAPSAPHGQSRGATSAHVCATVSRTARCTASSLAHGERGARTSRARVPRGFMSRSQRHLLRCATGDR